MKEIKAYITDELCSEQSAINTIEKIMKRIRQLADFPEIGAPLSSIINLQVPYRFLVCGNYTAFYKVEGGDEVHIIRVLYGRRNFMQILFGKSYDE
jgi:plasmid stabilization system protein ParE